MPIRPSQFTEYELKFTAEFMAINGKELDLELITGCLTGSLKNALSGIGMVASNAKTTLTNYQGEVK